MTRASPAAAPGAAGTGGGEGGRGDAEGGSGVAPRPLRRAGSTKWEGMVPFQGPQHPSHASHLLEGCAGILLVAQLPQEHGDACSGGSRWKRGAVQTRHAPEPSTAHPA